MALWEKQYEEKRKEKDNMDEVGRWWNDLTAGLGISIMTEFSFRINLEERAE